MLTATLLFLASHDLILYYFVSDYLSTAIYSKRVSDSSSFITMNVQSQVK